MIVVCLLLRTIQFVLILWKCALRSDSLGFKKHQKYGKKWIMGLHSSTRMYWEGESVSRDPKQGPTFLSWIFLGCTEGEERGKRRGLHSTCASLKAFNLLAWIFLVGPSPFTPWTLRKIHIHIIISGVTFDNIVVTFKVGQAEGPLPYAQTTWDWEAFLSVLVSSEQYIGYTYILKSFPYKSQTDQS